MADPPAAFNGLYVHAADAVADNKAALNSGYGYDDGQPGPHGTFTRIPFFWVRTEVENKIENKILRIFDHNGDGCWFEWNGQDAWVSNPSSFSFPCAPNKLFPGTASPETRHSALILDVYTESDVPSGAKPGDFYIHPRQEITTVGKMPSWPKPQKIRYDTYTRTFTWFTDQHPNGLEFEEAKRQPHEDCKDGHGCFGDVFQVQNHGYAQLAFPFCGFQPDKLTTSGPQWTGVSRPGTSAMYDSGDKKGGDKQDFGGTLIFNFPARDSKDYMASENVDGVPNFPLGFRARDIRAEFGETLSQLISTSQDEMNSWKVGLGLSGGIEKVLNVGLSGGYENKINISHEGTSRYAVTRKGAVAWIAITDPPNLSLHKAFVDEVQSRLALWMKKDPKERKSLDLNWKGFVDRFGTHYLHAMTHGWMEISTQVFSTQAESIAEHQGWNLKLTAKGTVDGASAGTQDSLEQAYETKFGTKVESDTVRYSKLGDPHSAVAIFLDLRQLHELFSPVFFQYNPADDFGSLAPVVWYDLRGSFAKYLEAFPTPTLINYSPRKFRLTILSIRHKVLLRVIGVVPQYIYATGPVNVTADPRETADYRKQIGTSGNMYVHANCVNDIGFHPDASFFATIVIPRSLSGPVKLCVETLFKLEAMGETGPEVSRKYYASFEQSASSITVSDEFFDIELVFGPTPE